MTDTGRFESWKWISGLAVALLFCLGAPEEAQAIDSTDITAGTPQRAGDVTIKFFKCVDAKCTHGTICTATATITAADIAGGFTKEQKAAKIQAAVNAACNITSIRVGAKVTATAPPWGIYAFKATDDTAETMLVDKNGVGIEVDYVTKVGLTGTPSSGNATFGEDGNSQTTTTTGKSISQIYSDWQALFGEGTIVGGEFVLPARTGTTRSFNMEVTDPGLTVTVTQTSTKIVPTLNQWGLILFGLLLLTAMFVAFRRRVLPT